eukprot:3524740-Lingulodinium_polyedra.AAC.1
MSAIAAAGCLDLARSWCPRERSPAATLAPAAEEHAGGHRARGVLAPLRANLTALANGAKELYAHTGLHMCVAL